MVFSLDSNFDKFDFDGCSNNDKIITKMDTNVHILFAVVMVSFNSLQTTYGIEWLECQPQTTYDINPNASIKDVLQRH